MCILEQFKGKQLYSFGEARARAWHHLQAFLGCRSIGR